jgi:hypothetical protein
MRNKKYKIVTALKPEWLEDYVLISQSSGWELYGELIVTHHSSLFIDIVNYYQVMVKHD